MAMNRNDIQMWHVWSSPRTIYNRSEFPWWKYIQRIKISIEAEDIQWIKISIMVEDIWHTLESNQESWNLMNTGMIKEVAYVEFNQSRNSSTQTTMSTYPTMWIEVSRLNIIVHHMITFHWCILLTDARSPTNNENGNQGTRVQTNKCE